MTVAQTGDDQKEENPSGLKPKRPRVEPPIVLSGSNGKIIRNSLLRLYLLTIN